MILLMSMGGQVREGGEDPQSHRHKQKLLCLLYNPDILLASVSHPSVAMIPTLYVRGRLAD